MTNQKDSRALQALTDELDKKFTEVIENARRLSTLHPLTFSGTVVGFMIKSGIMLAVNHGCPSGVLRTQLDEILKAAYGKD
jgi:hypothetical protein